MRIFKGTCEVGFDKDGMKQIIENFINEKMRNALLRDYQVDDIKISTNNKYCVRATFKAKEKDPQIKE